MRHDRAWRTGSHIADQIKIGLRSLPRTTYPIALRAALAFALALSFLVRLPAATPALAASVYFGGYGVDTYATFGPNATVAISGDIEGGCIDLFGQFSTYVFTAPHGSLSVGSAAPATPNAVITSSYSGGLFEDETIGFTAPDGKLGPGDYDVAMTLDCGHQTIGYVAGSDQPHGAFSVAIPVNVSNLPPSDISAIKSGAQSQATSWAHGARATAALFVAYDTYAIVSSLIGDPAEVAVGFYLDWVCAALPPDPNGAPVTWYCPTVGWSDIMRLQTAALGEMVGQAAHYQAIANDPPDPNYNVLVTLGPSKTYLPNTADPLEASITGLATQVSTDSATSQALLDAIQKYQGAQQAGNGPAALQQAVAVQKYSALLAQGLTAENTHLADVVAKTNASGLDFDGHATYDANLRQRLATSGFTAAETAQLQQVGLTATDRANLLGILTETAAANPQANYTMDSYAYYGTVQTNYATLQTQNTTAIQSLQQLSTDMGPIVSNLESQMGVTSVVAANAGGPYQGNVGTAISFNASASTTPAGTGPLSYAWDLLGNGTFADATGATPSFTFAAPRNGLVAVKVTNANGQSDVAYAPLTVAAVNQPPSITALSPAGPVVNVTLGTAITFSATVTDAENDQPAYQWKYDGTAIATAATYTRTFTGSDAGLHSLELDVSDPGGTAVRRLGLFVPLPPTASFSFSPTLAIAGQPIQLTDNSSSPSGSITAWSWDFGDGTTGTSQNPTHIYAKTGSYTVKLTITDQQNNTASTSKTISVVQAPTAAFTFSPVAPKAGDQIAFTDSSSSPNGAITAWAWTFGDGATSTSQNPAHTYAAPGSYTSGLTITDNVGATASVTHAVTVAPKPVAAFSTSKGHNVALAGDGATIAAFSSQYSASYPPTNAIDGNPGTAWLTASGQVTNQWIKVQLPPGPQLVDQVVLQGPGGGQDPKDFQVRVSTTTADDAAFTTVLTAQHAENNTAQTFTFAPVQAKYVELFVSDDWGYTGYIQVYQFQVWTVDRQGGIVSWPYGPAASIAGFSSDYNSSYPPANAIDDDPNTTWASAYGQGTNQYFKVQLGGGQTYAINRVQLTNYSSYGIKDFDVRVSTTTADDAAFTTVFSGTAANVTTPQVFSFPAAAAKYVELFAKDGYYAGYVQISTFQALTPDGLNAARLGGVGAQVVNFSSEYSPSASFLPSNAVDSDPTSSWYTASGQTTNQWLKLILPGQTPYLVDRVRLAGTGGGDGIKDFQIRVSTTTSDDAAFTTVVTGTLPEDNQTHWATFAPVAAKYVELYVPDNYGYSGYLRVPDFEVYSPQQGGATVPFVDLSSEVGGSIASWSWDFGDGTTSTAENPSHTYSASGTYPVTLTVTDGAGATSSATFSYTAFAAPTVDFSWTPTTPLEGGSATFTGTTSANLAVAWSWVARGVLQSTSPTAGIGFPNTGTYPVTLSVTDSNQFTASVTKDVTVQNVPPKVIIAPLQYAPGGQVFSFSPQVTDPGNGDVIHCQWDYGDGATSAVSTNCAFSHTYAPPPAGTRSLTYTATLTATDQDGGVGTGQGQIVVSPGLSLVQISTTFDSPIGVDYHEPTNEVLLSVNYSGGQPHNFELVAQNGSHAQFSNVSGLTDEVYITTVRSGPCEGGFTVGEAFTGTGKPGEIARIAADGSSAQIPWVTLPGENGLLRGGLFQDRFCAFGGDLIVVTNTGNVWRVTSAGVATRIASGVGGYLEGVTTIPNDPATYGPWAGKILAGQEYNGCLYSIDAQGNAQCWLQGMGGWSPEGVNVVPQNGNFFGVDYGDSKLMGAPASAMTWMVGDVVVASEYDGRLWDVHWDPVSQTFQPLMLAKVTQWEGSNFSSAGIAEIPPGPTNTSTPTNTPTTTDTPTATATPTLTSTPSPTATDTPTLTATATDTPTDTPTLTSTPSSTATSTLTFTATATATIADTVAPSCAVTGVGTNSSGQKYIQITTQDTGSGIGSITLTTLVNVTASVGSYQSGIGTVPTTVQTADHPTSPVVVIATKINQSLGSQVAMQVVDAAGNVTTCDPVLATVGGKSGQPGWQVFTGLSQSESVVRITNGQPGLRRVLLIVDGRKMAVDNLRPNEVRTVDVSSAMRSGDQNAIVVRGTGPRDGTADILIWDGSGSQAPNVAGPAGHHRQLNAGAEPGTDHDDGLLDWLG